MRFEINILAMELKHKLPHWLAEYGATHGKKRDQDRNLDGVPEAPPAASGPDPK